MDRYILASVSRNIGVRETSRIVGEHVLTEDEVLHGTVFPDAVAVSTYHLDFHWPDRMQRAGTGITTMVEPYHLSLGCMIPKGAKNLLVPGRGASAEQMAMSSFRVMAIVSQMGFAAGKAAQLCVEQNRRVPDLDIETLQRRIERGGQSLDLSDYGNYLRDALEIKEFVFEGPQPFAQCIRPEKDHVGRIFSEELGFHPDLVNTFRNQHLLHHGVGMKGFVSFDYDLEHLPHSRLQMGMGDAENGSPGYGFCHHQGNHSEHGKDEADRKQGDPGDVKYAVAVHESLVLSSARRSRMIVVRSSREN